MEKIKKYYRLYKSFFNASLVADLEFRFNFFVLICGEFIWYSTQLVLYEVLYKHTSQLAGWNLPQMRVFIFLALFVDSIYMILWDQNFVKFAEDLRKGNLDLLLTKPINEIFMLTSQKISISHLPCLFITGGGVIWALTQIPDFTWWRLLWLLIMIPSGLSVIYCGRFMLNATTILFERADFLQYVWHSLFRFGLRPDGIYSAVMNGFLRYILIFIVPFAMVASIPARFLLEPIQPIYLIWGVLMPIILIYLTKKYWRYCVRNYASASS
ncbi:MAG: ABC-2 family transporter protein [Bdellovibrionaceae bacterium]|nr:ABC-2 family transporter protein [Pseudobdellovibrionaceae bacterium]